VWRKSLFLECKRQVEVEEEEGGEEKEEMTRTQRK